MISAAGETRTLLVPPEQRTPGVVVKLVAKAFAGELLTVVCAWCGRVQLGDGSWYARPRLLKKGATLTHGICPDCADEFTANQRPKAP
jgi:hypothetical protein